MVVHCENSLLPHKALTNICIVKSWQWYLQSPYNSLVQHLHWAHCHRFTSLLGDSITERPWARNKNPELEHQNHLVFLLPSGTSHTPIAFPVSIFVYHKEYFTIPQTESIKFWSKLIHYFFLSLTLIHMVENLAEIFHSNLHMDIFFTFPEHIYNQCSISLSYTSSKSLF